MGILASQWLGASMQVAFYGRLQLLHLIQGGWVQGVGVDEAHKVFFVVCLAEASMASWSLLATSFIPEPIGNLFLLHHSAATSRNSSSTCGRLCVEQDIIVLQQLLEPEGRPVPQVEETVSGVVAMQGLFHPATRVWAFVLGIKGIVAATAELVAALGAVKMHAASSGQCIRELALGTVNSIFLKIHCQTMGLILWVIIAFPVLKILAAPTPVLLFPLAFTAHTEGLVTLGTRGLQLLPFIYEAKGALGTPQKLGVSHEHSLSQLLVE